MKHRIVPMVIILLVLAGLGGYYWYSTANAADPNKLELSGNIEATRVNVAAETTGRILELKAANGAEVKKGDTLAELDSTLLGLQYDQAKAALAAAGVAGNPVQVALAQANFNLSEYNLKRATVTAPVDGTVIDRPYNAGEMATAGAALFTLADLSKVTMTVYVPENSIGKIKLNGSVDLKTDSFANDTFKGTITKIAEKAEFTPASIQTKEQRVNLVFAVTISLDNADGKLKPGMPADATISLK
jgi:HlyD family secretion protein